MIFYLGTHHPHWLGLLDVPLMVSRNRLAPYRTLPEARRQWVLDSGGFTELSQHGRWRIGPATYADEVRRYQDGVGRMLWCAPQDWMCEPWIVAKTGLTVREHQHRTVGNYLDLKAEGIPVIPVLQGWDLADYEYCADLYDKAGVRLANEFTVGLGSVCRRQATMEIGMIALTMHNRGIQCHGFGCKSGAIQLYGDWLASADSMAWSYSGRRNRPCPQGRAKNCANCMHYALNWRERVLASARDNAAIQMSFWGSA